MKLALIVLFGMQLLALSLALTGCTTVSDQDYYDKVSRENDENWRRMSNPCR